MSIELKNGIYDFNSVDTWYLIHDETNVIAKGQGGQATSKHIILEHETEEEMEATITALGLIEIEYEI